MIARISPITVCIIEQFYERDSLRNTDTGFELRFKNRLAPSTIVEFRPLTLDGLVYEADNLVFAIERAAEGHRRPTDVVFRANDIKDDRSRFFDINAFFVSQSRIQACAWFASGYADFQDERSRRYNRIG